MRRIPSLPLAMLAREQLGTAAIPRVTGAERVTFADGTSVWCPVSGIGPSTPSMAATDPSAASIGRPGHLES